MRKYVGLFLFCLFVLGQILFAEEGMWTFDNPPIQLVKEKYGFTITQEWLDHVRLSSVRFMDGGSGSFVSPYGLVLTNHHVAIGQLQKMSTAEKDYVALGFYAPTLADEVKCPDLEVNVLVSMENVTERIRSVTQNLDEQQALKAREAEIAKIESEAKEKTGLKPEVVSLYRGGEFWLYLYKKYTDVRLVMAPERQSAYFGGDSDNFTYPRYDLDMAFFRVYENDQPLQSFHYLTINPRGASENELVFVSGHPGSTNRLYTVAQLEYQRDIRYPLILSYLDKRINVLHEYMKNGPEAQRRALRSLFGLENAKKAYTGEYQGLLSPNIISQKQKEEQELKKQIQKNPEWKKSFGKAFDLIEKAVKKQRAYMRSLFFQRIMGSRLYDIAEDIVFYTIEKEKPDTERLEGYHEAEKDELLFYLFSPAPIYEDLEKAVFLGSLKMSMEELGLEHPFIKTVLNGEAPEKVVEDLVYNTQLYSVEFRKRLVEGGKSAVDTCRDPMIGLLRKLEPILRKNVEWGKKEIDSPLSFGSEKIAQALFAIYGKNRPPDATFTLRLSYGTVRGYPMNGTITPYKTTLYGLFDRALSFDQKGEWWLPNRFWERKDKLDLSTPVNFVSTCDIIGGNSGSPVINQNAECVGLIFDGNIESLVGRFVYDETANRAVAVHSAYILEALRKLYDAEKLAEELEGQVAPK